VFQVTDAEGTTLALKRMLCQTEELRELAQREKEILFQFHHENILRAVDSEMRPRPDKGLGAYELLLLLPFARHGTLEDILNRERIEKGEEALSPFSEKEVWKIFHGICKGVAEFHAASLSPRDLKPANVLMFERTLPKLSDFGSVGPAKLSPGSRKEALKLQHLFETTTTVMFRAPECFKIEANAKITEAIDIWALGCILFALMFNHSPFETAYKTGNVGLAALSGNYTFPENNKYSEELKQTVVRLLSVDPNFRPCIKEVLDMIRATPN